MFDQNNDKSKYEDILKRYPKKRIILNEKYKEIYKDHYISNRGGKGVFNFFSQKMESWMHKKVSKIQAKNILELGAGNLNHVKYESNYLNYDIVEPFKDLLGEVIKNNGRDYFNIAPKEQPPRKLSGKRTVAVITLESRLCLTEGVNLSGFKTDGVQKSYYGCTKNSFI